MDVQVLGAANEVGRSGFLVNCNGTKLLLDYGVMFGRRGSPPQYPLHVKPKDLDAIIITHAHLDHSGNVPSLFVSRVISAEPPQATSIISTTISKIIFFIPHLFARDYIMSDDTLVTIADGL